MTSLPAIGLVASLLTTAAASQQLVVNVDAGDAGSAYSGQGVIVDPGNDHWNAIGGSGTNLLASDGATPTGISVDLLGDSTFTGSNPNGLLADYVYASRWGAVAIGDISITGLQANADYLIYVFSAGNALEEAGVITLNGVTGCTNGSRSPQFIEGDNYTLVEARSDATGTITGTFDPLDAVCAINGLQITQDSLPPRVRSIEGAESPTVRSPGDTFPVTVTFSDTVSLSQAGGAAIDLDVEGTLLTAVHAGATVGSSLTFTANAPATTTMNARVVADSLRLLGGATLVDGALTPVVLDHDEVALPNDQISVERLSVYPPVASLSAHESKHYRFRVREVGGSWQSTFAWFTKCVDFPTTEWGYYSDHIGGWSHTYCNFEMANNVPIEVEITRLDPTSLTPIDITSAVPHPRRNVRSWRVEAGKAYVTLDHPALFAVDIDRQFDDYITPAGPLLNEDALHGVSVFANPFILDKPDPLDPDVLVVDPSTPAPDDGPWTTLYFLPGVHQLHSGTWAFDDDFRLRGNRSYYIPGNAIVHGNMNNDNNSMDANGVRIFGHGTLSGERIDHPFHLGILAFEDQLKSSPIRVTNGAKGCKVEGVTLADPAFHACTLDGGYNGRPEDHNHVRWTKVIGWRANSDGITPNGSGYVEDCFLRTQDDGTYVMGLGIRRMVYWHDVNGMPLRCSQLTKHNDAVHTKGPLYVEDIDVIYARTFFGAGPGRSVIGYPTPDGNFPGTTGAHVVFRDVQVEDLHPTRRLFGWDLDAATGVNGGPQPVSGVRFENVRAAAPNIDREQDVFLGDPVAPISGLTFDNVTLAGQHYADIGDFATNGFVSGLLFRNTDPVTITYRNTSGYGKWYLNDDWDTGAEPANNDIVQHTAVAGVLTVDAPAYAGDLIVAHAGTATVAVQSDGQLTVTGAMAIGTIGNGALELLDGTVRLDNSASTALTLGTGALHLEKGVLRWAGDHVGDIQSLYASGAITFANGQDAARPATATLIAQTGPSSLYAEYDSNADLTSVFVMTPIVFGSGCGSPALAFTPDVTGQPVIGQTATATISNAPVNVGGAILGLSNQTIRGAPLPLPLAAIGMPGCSLWQSSEVVGLPVLPLTASTMRYSLAVPNNPALIDASLYLQAFAVAPMENPLGLIVSNGIAWTFDGA
ncbi:MAG: hypothetical protein AAF628_36310 [Planctomycetota bacterium]